MGQSKKRRGECLKAMYVAEGNWFETWQDVKSYADSHYLIPISMQTVHSEKGVRYIVNFKSETNAQLR
jgi:hypothetical protein